jgi:hypothetical protein
VLLLRCVIVALQGCVIVALQGCVIVALQGCMIVALQGCVIVLLRANCVVVAMQGCKVARLCNANNNKTEKSFSNIAASQFCFSDLTNQQQHYNSDFCKVA